MTRPGTVYTLPPRIWHCKPCNVEWNSHTQNGCWMCGATGKSGRMPLGNGMSAPPLHGGMTWVPTDEPSPLDYETQEAA